MERFCVKQQTVQIKQTGFGNAHGFILTGSRAAGKLNAVALMTTGLSEPHAQLESS
jgi:hypothetical protein